MAEAVRGRLGLALIAAGALGMTSIPPASASPPALPGARLERVELAGLAGWAGDDHAAALAVFARGCAADPPLRAGLRPPAALEAACAEARTLAPDEARAFFERRFVALRIVPEGGTGFLTGYFEPVFPGALERSDDFPVPLYGRPSDLVTWRAEDRPAAAPAGFEAARRRADGGLEPYPSRAEIETGPLAASLPVVAWLRDAIDRFVMQVQGSSRLALPDGTGLRLAYDGRNGHPYVSLGRELSRDEAIPPAEMTMDRLVARLKADPAWAAAFMRRNPSFVFFRRAGELAPGEGPVGGAGLSLTEGRSIAADRTLWPYGLPVWLSGTLPTATRGGTEPLGRLTIIQDTGSAIVGPSRFDLYIGSGPEAGFVAGLVRHPVEATVLWPRDAGPDAGLPRAP